MADNEYCKDPSFDILDWWKEKSIKYYVFSRMSKDILVILVLTIFYELTFSTDGQEFDPISS